MPHFDHHDLNFKIDAHDAHLWMRRNLPASRVRNFPSGAVCINPRNSDLRRLLKSKSTPKGVKGHLYSWLLYRIATS
jgi:hypothetical protein